ncbi:ABC transporter permease [Rhodoplanes roseus]|uniref:Aliphatic sulfonate ABC transporter n=1 Tax=Rhodoplanes roseus TaxID=29409 RepID=A0A327KYM3_9BRAD|nr:ABC transporter permease subunit [Rhodoplanes roseus]RAI43167.1 aliphatic sulfonate ABC transporter [Rhodoplanes roseus]
MSRTGVDRGPALTGAATLVGLFVLLELAIRVGLVDRYVVPPPSEVITSFGRIVTEENIPQRFAQTALEGLGAGVLITIVGVPLGVLLYRRMVLRAAVQSWVAALAAAPLVLAYPLFLVIFGRSAWTIVMMGFVSGVAPVILKTLEGLTATRRVLIDVGRSLKLTPMQQFRLVLLPAAVPTIFVGLRLGLIFALINVVGLEFLINFGGLGQLINELAERYDLPGTYAAIAFVVLVSVLFFAGLERTERWLRPGR